MNGARSACLLPSSTVHVFLFVVGGCPPVSVTHSGQPHPVWAGRPSLAESEFDVTSVRLCVCACVCLSVSKRVTALWTGRLQPVSVVMSLDVSLCGDELGRLRPSSHCPLGTPDLLSPWTLTEI